MHLRRVQRNSADVYSIVDQTDTATEATPLNKSPERPAAVHKAAMQLSDDEGFDDERREALRRAAASRSAIAGEKGDKGPRVPLLLEPRCEPPLGLDLTTPESMAANAAKIHAQAVATKTMPLGNYTRMTEEEREILGRWIDAGAPLP